ncbi:MAG: molybdenum cofactor guanylyltransferase MobA [Cycloclasticus sp.]|nr:molybdenum cofactor guanylyltransferase MobA [Cycloclasticus sp.]MBG97348.1 molybdenum cofactor guanylyltransferase MobA [Cycloclasticus sp.]HAI97144.1 molybdenum cofactor guanylyltransferase MobA [Methylococcaceae bacterium]|tara:strand:+ start:1744 stop:2370 length:627 start_codon:yes stop_codon:yes gene_type:complete
MPKKINGIVGAVLAGGLSRRMNKQNKSFIPLNGKPLIDYVIDTLSQQCDTIVINSNENDSRLASYNHPVVKDSLKGYLGPLAGILAVMEWTKQHLPDCKWIVTAPVDTPFLPEDLVSTLYQSHQKNQSALACACSNGRTHPVIGLWPVNLFGELRQALVNEDLRKIDLWTSRYSIAHPNFAYDVIDPFFNINCDKDLLEAESLLSSDG